MRAQRPSERGGESSRARGGESSGARDRTSSGARDRTSSGARDRESQGFASARSGQTETIGVVLLLVVSAAATAIVLSGSVGVVDDARRGAEVERNGQAMTALDSRTAEVALGESPARTVTLGDSGAGGYQVDEDAGWIRVVHKDRDDGSTETLYNTTLGAVVYENGDATMAYQGGGVWRGGPDGAVMVSPPELGYRDATLTMPVVRVRGSDGAAGHVTATVTRPSPTTNVFPAESPAADDTRRNPVTDGDVIVTVHSEFYRGWATFFERRTEGNVSVDPANRTATVRLVAGGASGRFDMPAEGNAVDLRGVAGHPIENFTIVLHPDDTDDAKFHNLQWTMYADAGSREFEIHLRHGGEADDPATNCTEVSVDATVYYSDTNGATYEGWQEDDAFRTECYERGDDTAVDETRLVANLSGTTPLTAGSLESDDAEHFNPSTGTSATPFTVGGHGADWEPSTYAAGDQEAIGRLIDHYLTAMGPEVSLVVDDKPSDTVNEDPSWGVIAYDGQGTIAFLYITENEVHVDFE